MDVVETTVELAGRTLTIEHPPDAVELIDEAAFEREEFLPYWAELWPSGVALAQVIAARPSRGEAVLELGCGLALPSIVAALGGARVLATDWSPDALVFARRNAERNGAELETALVAWADAGELAQRGPWQLVLAADVLYERRNVDPLLSLLPRLGSEALLADPGRPALPAFLAGARTRWHVTETPTAELPRGGVFRLLSRQYA
ncbi:MAG: 50S ribosomal protein L11 methyltransferase [Gaiellaceae bacterium MAG52_C11]|nr:50S ribosomal protein L11 methyltransferase [Candidatus Gaiellasilicea maunaloa]